MKTILSQARMAVLTGFMAVAAMTLAAQAGARDRSSAGHDIVRTAQISVYGDDDDDRRGRGRGRGGDDARPYVPLESIIAQIQARTPGRLVGVRGPNGQGIYRIIWETPDGRVITFVVDGRTGQILR
jgi:uncharacterized membrane protein YkoI